MMSLRAAILLSLSVGFLIIGVHQTMTVGFSRAYWAIMVSLVLFFTHGLLKSRAGAERRGGKPGKPPAKH